MGYEKMNVKNLQCLHIAYATGRKFCVLCFSRVTFDNELIKEPEALTIYYFVMKSRNFQLEGTIVGLDVKFSTIWRRRTEQKLRV